MKFNVILIAAIMVGVIGCGNTADGVKKDVEAGGENASKTMENASDSSREATAGMKAATMLTPKIKLAITADVSLNDSKNTINVNSTEDTVTLEGHVTSAALKELAAEIAKKVMTENGATQKIENLLYIST